MKLRQKLVSHFLRLADLYRMGSVAAAVVALVLVFGLTQPINLPRHNAMLEHFSHLQNDESRLGEAVLQLNFSLTNNYDQVTGLIEHLRAIVRELREGEVARVLREDEAFMQQLDLLQQRLNQQRGEPGEVQITQRGFEEFAALSSHGTRRCGA
jgi:hypothetical protein